MDHPLQVMPIVARTTMLLLLLQHSPRNNHPRRTGVTPTRSAVHFPRYFHRPRTLPARGGASPVETIKKLQ